MWCFFVFKEHELGLREILEIVLMRFHILGLVWQLPEGICFSGRPCLMAFTVLSF